MVGFIVGADPSTQPRVGTASLGANAGRCCAPGDLGSKEQLNASIDLLCIGNPGPLLLSVNVLESMGANMDFQMAIPSDSYL